MSKDENTSRIEGVEKRIGKIEVECEKVEEQLEKVEDKSESIDKRVTDVETQLGRITSHIESEIGLARRDVSRSSERNADDLKKISTKLFGDESDVYGGRIGQLTKGQHKFEKKIAWATGISITLLSLFEIFIRLLPTLLNLVNKK